MSNRNQMGILSLCAGYTAGVNHSVQCMVQQFALYTLLTNCCFKNIIYCFSSPSFASNFITFSMLKILSSIFKKKAMFCYIKSHGVNCKLTSCLGILQIFTPTLHRNSNSVAFNCTFKTNGYSSELSALVKVNIIHCLSVAESSVKL